MTDYKMSENHCRNASERKLIVDLVDMTLRRQHSGGMESKQALDLDFVLTKPYGDFTEFGFIR